MELLQKTELKRQSMNARFISRLNLMTGGMSQDHINKIIPVIEEIRELKREKNAVILAHYYMNPILQISVEDGGIADFTGDSLGLSVQASKSIADNIIFCGVAFMAETAHILNPDKQVFIPDKEAGCSLASSITAEDVRALKSSYPGVPVIAYINTYAETKAECDICCTSRNAMKIAASFESDKIIFIPDKFMGRNLSNSFKSTINKEFILWDGRCEVHEQFMGNIDGLMDMYPDAEVLLHWEVPDSTVNSALQKGHGTVGSTSDLINYVRDTNRTQFILGSECDLGATLKGMFSEKEFITPCITCFHMKRISLQNTLESLRAIGTEDQLKYLVELDDETRQRAYIPVKKMIDMS
jgi:quinolinate synthase